MSVRTRFAPSPTGLLHIGSARSALFNYLFSRHHGGTYLIRVEDTDRERSKPEFTDAILAGLAWLGIPPDEPPVFQSTRAPRHAEIAHEMLARGRAYYCYCTPDELRQMRETAAAEGRPPRYDGTWRDRDPAEAPAGVKPVIRLKAPREGATTVHDLIQGEITVNNSELDDLIILRSDGSPTYLHAVVVDDHDMDITHVIRGDDHMTNTFRQIQIYNAMDWNLPRFAHMPLIHGADGAKLSKRHGAVNLLDFRDDGFLPEAMMNFLMRLGWSHGDTEILDREEAIRLFDLDGVGRSAARMDYTRLLQLNGVWLRRADDERLTNDVVERLTAQGLDAERVRERILGLMPFLKERAKTLVDLADSTAFLARHMPLSFEEKAQALLTAEAKAALPALATVLDGTDWTAPALDAALRAYAEANGQKLGKVAQPLRAALTGSTMSPPIDQTLAALGREEALARIAAAAA
ncbi:MAG: glutamate--tRNA ligase [Janthinobacterium lividum]